MSQIEKKAEWMLAGATRKIMRCQREMHTRGGSELKTIDYM